MFQIINNLRNKPEHKRKAAALFLASFVVGIIFIVWITTLVTRLSIDEEQELSASEQETRQQKSLLGQSKEIFYGGVNFINGLSKPVKYNQIDDVKESLNKPDFLEN